LAIILFLYGILIGLLVSLPVGAVAVLLFQRTLNSGVWQGVILGSGAAVADTIYATIAIFGISYIADFLFLHKVIIGISGSIFLLIMGYRIFAKDTVKEFKQKRTFSKRNMLNDFLASFIVAISNPLTLIAFGGIFASLTVIHNAGSNFLFFILLFGVLIGSVLWWFILAYVVEIFRKKLNLKNIVLINRVSGIFVFLFGLSLIFYISFSSHYLFFSVKHLLHIIY